MTNLYEAGELLEQIKLLIAQNEGKEIVQTPDGRDPVYWPITIYGRTGMMKAHHETDYKLDLRPKIA